MISTLQLLNQSPQLISEFDQILQEAAHRWFHPSEIYEILSNYKKFYLTPNPPVRPSAGSLFLFDRKALPHFRKDGHRWTKTRDGKTAREAHVKLKFKRGSVHVLDCYYAHGLDGRNFQRRSYWMLDERSEDIVLVHYRDVTESSKLGVPCLMNTNPEPQLGSSQISSTPFFERSHSLDAAVQTSYYESSKDSFDWNEQTESSGFQGGVSGEDSGTLSVQSMHHSASHGTSFHAEKPIASPQSIPDVPELVKEDISHLRCQQVKLKQALNSVGNGVISSTPSDATMPRRIFYAAIAAQLEKAAGDESVGRSKYGHKRKLVTIREGKTFKSVNMAPKPFLVEPVDRIRIERMMRPKEEAETGSMREGSSVVTPCRGSHDRFTEPGAGIGEGMPIADMPPQDRLAALLDKGLHMETVCGEVLLSSSLEALEKLGAAVQEWGRRSSSHETALAQLKTTTESSKKRDQLAENELLNLRQLHVKMVKEEALYKRRVIEAQAQLTVANDNLVGEIARREAAETEWERLKMSHDEELKRLTDELELLEARAVAVEKEAAEDSQRAEASAIQVAGLEESLDREFGLGFFTGYRDLRDRVNADHPDWDLSSYDPQKSLVWDRQ